MPSLGADMTAGTVVAWHVAPGEAITRGQIIAEVETEKGVFDVESSASGTLADVMVAAGTKVPVGTVLAHIALPDDARAGTPAPPAAAQPLPAAPAPVTLPETDGAHQRATTMREREHVLASPLARRIAEARGIDLSRVSGTGPRGAVTKEDVERAITTAPSKGAEPALATQPAGAPPTAGVRQAIARAVSLAWRDIPHYYLSLDVDLSRAMQWLRDQNERRSLAERLLTATMLVRAVVGALHEFPDLNGFWVSEALQHSTAVNVALVIARRTGGIVAPALRDADTLDVGALNAALRDLVQRARTGRLRSSEMTDASITITSLGDEGVHAVFGVIYPPQVALIGFGGITNRPWAAGDLLGVRPVVTVTLAADHRATDGHYGSRFLSTVARRLQDPEHA
jgi:pyruvate dehydrogenase E2 component (dihydrolipoamide acetyltransferase)